MDLKARLEHGNIIILSGAMGTEIQRRGVKTTLPLWSAQALIDQPNVVREIHEDYINAGAELIPTNTFRTQRRTFQKVNAEKRTEELTKRAVQLAQNARAHTHNHVIIAGCVTTLEDCYSPELVPPDDVLFPEHEEHARFLNEGGVDVLLIETMNSIREIDAALRAAMTTKLPTLLRVLAYPGGTLPSGESLAQLIQAIKPYQPLALLINCVPAHTILPLLKELRGLTDLPLGAYGQGEGQPGGEEGWLQSARFSPDSYAALAAQWVKETGAQIIGSCCGSTPEYTKKLKEILPRSLY